MTRKPLVALAAALTIGAGMGAFASEAAATTYGGVKYFAAQPFLITSSCTQINSFNAYGTATVTGTFSARVMDFYNGGWRVFASRDATLLRGTTYNFTWELNNGNRQGVKWRNQAKFAGGAWNVSPTWTGPAC